MGRKIKVKVRQSIYSRLNGRKQCAKVTQGKKGHRGRHVNVLTFCDVTYEHPVMVSACCFPVPY